MEYHPGMFPLAVNILEFCKVHLYSLLCKGGSDMAIRRNLGRNTIILLNVARDVFDIEGTVGEWNFIVGCTEPFVSVARDGMSESQRGAVKGTIARSLRFSFNKSPSNHYCVAVSICRCC